MTEQEWLASDDLTALFEHLVDTREEGGTIYRQFLLVACGCCRRGWDLVQDERSRAAIEATEAFADGVIEAEELHDAGEVAQEVVKEAQGGDPEGYYHSARHHPPLSYVDAAAHVAWYDDEYTYGYGSCVGRSSWGATTDDDRAAEAAILREVIGNPFRRVAVAPAWLTPDVRRLARALYDERAFDRLAILADALEEAGCTNNDVLEHLRGPGPHVLGCWALDLVLAKEEASSRWLR